MKRNVTRVRRWDVNYETDIAHSTVSSVGYNTTGSAIFSRDPLGHQTTISFADSFSSNGINTTTPPGLTLAYPTMVTVNDPGPISSTTKYNYDLGMITPKFLTGRVAPSIQQRRVPIMRAIRLPAAGNIRALIRVVLIRKRRELMTVTAA